MNNNNRKKKNPAGKSTSTAGLVRAVLYARVSTRDKQETENQLIQLREFCKNSGYVILEEFVDHESGAKSDRPRFRVMFERARQRQFDRIVFWSLDRFSREGVRKTLQYLTEIEEFGVTYQSFTQRWIDSAGPFRDVVIAIMATLAAEERKLISDRVTAGLERAKKEGIRIGRPKSVLNGEELYRESIHKTMNFLARKYQTSKATICRRIAEHEATLDQSERHYRRRHFRRDYGEN